MESLANVLKGKSKTINVNAVLGAAVILAQEFGLAFPTEYAPYIVIGANVLLRFVTEKPLYDK
jgi:hypothetical protein